MNEVIGVSGAFIQTYSGVRFDILDPKPDMINIDDLAHHLANQCRFTGATRHHYSVAQHSYYCSFLTPLKFAFEALMHDASEAYLCDMSRPVKHCTKLGEVYRELEERIQNAVQAKFGIAPGMSAEVKIADNLMLFAEKAQLMQSGWWTSKGEAANIKIEKWSPERAEIEWRVRFFALAPEWAKAEYIHGYFDEIDEV